MLFNSIEFLFFFPIVTILFFLLPHKTRWLLLLIASCFFYMFFKPEYILILFFTIIIDYYAGILIENALEPQRRKRFLIMSLVANIGVLAIFKYYNFINDNITGLATLFGGTNHIPYLNMLLPIGLSFHTFQAMSYTIEVYRGNHKAERHFGIYSLYVMFYPQLVAGPIERPQNILYQFHEKKHFDWANLISGLKQMLFGFFKKIVIADRLSIYVDTVFNDLPHHHGWEVITAIVFFAFQIYCDFSGYSDIAIGAARVMGFKLMTNFNRPYFSKSIAEFWKRWHISLSTWFRDYLYISLGGNKVGEYRRYFNLFIVFLVSGLWHGANWTFVIWGALNGLYLIGGVVTGPIRQRLATLAGLQHVPKLRQFADIMVTFALVSFAWIFFRANNLSDAMLAIKNSTLQLGSTWHVIGEHSYYFLIIGLLIFIEYWWGRKDSVKKFLAKSEGQWRIARFSYYSLLFWLIVVWGVFDKKSFIYFQF